jgi:hypothetical protein
MKATIIPDDKMVIVGGQPLTMNFDLPNIRAVQVSDSHCEIDYTDERERAHFESVPKNVQAIIDAHQAEVKRINDEAAALAAKIASAPKFIGTPILKSEDVDSVVLDRVGDLFGLGLRKDIQLGRELRSIKFVLMRYAIKTDAVVARQRIGKYMTDAQWSTFVAQVEAAYLESLDLAAEVVKLRSGGEAFKKANGF